MHLSIPLLVLFLVLQVGDGVTTYRGLSEPSGNVSEANPVARWAFKRFGLAAPIAALKLAMSALGVALALSHHIVGTAALGILSAMGVYVLVNNLRVLRQAE